MSHQAPFPASIPLAHRTMSPHPPRGGRRAWRRRVARGDEDRIRRASRLRRASLSRGSDGANWAPGRNSGLHARVDGGNHCGSRAHSRTSIPSAASICASRGAPRARADYADPAHPLTPAPRRGSAAASSGQRVAPLCRSGRCGRARGARRPPSRSSRRCRAQRRRAAREAQSCVLAICSERPHRTFAADAARRPARHPRHPSPSARRVRSITQIDRGLLKRRGDIGLVVDSRLAARATTALLAPRTKMLLVAPEPRARQRNRAGTRLLARSASTAARRIRPVPRIFAVLSNASPSASSWSWRGGDIADAAHLEQLAMAPPETINRGRKASRGSAKRGDNACPSM